MVLAFSLHSDVTTVGAYAGFAAIIGLALLVLLYFAQARELRRMSDTLEEQAARLRAGPPMPMPRPVVAPPGQLPGAAPGPGATAAAVAVPGVRRVSVAAVGAGAPAALAADSPPASTLVVARPAAATDSPGAANATPPDVESPGAVPAAATVAGALGTAITAPAPAPASPAGERADSPGSADSPAGAGSAGGVEVTRVTVPAGASVSADGSASPESTDAQDAPASPQGGDAPADPSAKPVGAAAALRSRPAPSASPAGALETPPKPPAEPQTNVAPGVVSAAAPVSEGRTGVRGEADSQAEEPAPPADEPPALRPSTPAGARPRFPPAPVATRAAPVGATAAEAAAALGLPAEAPTRRRRRERPAPDRDDQGPPPRSRALLRQVAAAVVLLAVLIFVASEVFGGSSSKPHPSPTPSGRQGSPPAPATVRVAVLNGTHTSGLATRVSRVLTRLGFTQGAIADAPSQNHTATLVGYTAGNRAAALEVAADLAPTHTRVGLVDPVTAAVADAHSAAPNVIVTLGSDYTQQ